MNPDLDSYPYAGYLVPIRYRCIRFNLFFICGEFSIRWRRRPRLERHQFKIKRWRLEMANAESNRFCEYITNTVNPALAAEREKKGVA